MTGMLAFGTREGDRPGAERIGRAVERLGYSGFWSGDSGGYGGIATLAHTARGTTRIALGVGAIPIQRFTTEEIVAQLDQAGLPDERVTICLGAGRGGRLADVRHAVGQLRAARPRIGVGLAAVGPKMCELAGEIADVVLLSWCLPERIRWSRTRIEEGAANAGRSVPPVGAYLRVAIGDEAAERIQAEMAGYQQAPHYARSFGDQVSEVIGIALTRPDADELSERLAPYRAVLDTCVIRGLTESDDTEALLEFVELAAPRTS